MWTKKAVQMSVIMWLGFLGEPIVLKISND